MFIGEGKFESLISKINEEILLEKRRGGLARPTIVEQLSKYRYGNYYMTFAPNLASLINPPSSGGEPKLGINPRNPYNTPTGIYSYPIEQMWYNIVANQFPFAADRPNIYVFKAKDESRIVYTSSYTKERMIEDFKKMIRLYKGQNTDKYHSEVILHHTDQVIETKYNQFLSGWSPDGRTHPKNPLSFIWTYSRQLVHDNINKWTALLYKLYDGIVDDGGLGIIHPNEPIQAVFFNSRAVKAVDLIKNPNKGLDHNWGGSYSGILRSPEDVKNFEERVRIIYEPKKLLISMNNPEMDLFLTPKFSKLTISDTHLKSLMVSTKVLEIRGQTKIDDVFLGNEEESLVMVGNPSIKKFHGGANLYRLTLVNSKNIPKISHNFDELSLYNWKGNLEDIPESNISYDSRTVSNLAKSLKMSRREIKEYFEKLSSKFQI